MTTQKEKYLKKEYHLEGLAQLMYHHSQNAIRALCNHEDNDNYNVVLGFNQMAYQTYLTLVQYYEMHREEIESYQTERLCHYYIQFQNEISGTISRKDKNLLFVESSFTEYKEAQREYVDYVQGLRGRL